MLALFLVVRASWPQVDSRLIVAVAVVLGLSYTLFSEWLNIEIRQSWAYRDIMPVVPIVDAGLSPVLQWIIVPLAAFWVALRPRSLDLRTEIAASDIWHGVSHGLYRRRHLVSVALHADACPALRCLYYKTGRAAWRE